MSMTVRRAGAGVGLAAAIFVAPAALAQYTNEPFFEWTVMQSRAIGLELAAQRLRIVEALEPPYDEEFAEVVENLTGPDFERFAGTLEAADEDFAEQLYEVLEAIAEGIEEGEDVADLVPVGLGMLATAYDLVIPAELRELPAFKGGVMAQLLLGEGGVAEGLEEAFEEEWEFANGWAALQRIKVLWAEVASLATDQQRVDIDEMIAILDEIYPSPQPPESFAGIDPEEAETPSQRIVGILEVVLDSALYSGRDQVRLLGHLEGVAAPACESYEAGDNALGREVMYAILDHYAGETTGLGDLIGLFAPEVHEEAMEALEQLVIVEGDDDDEGEEAEEGEGPASDDDDDEDDDIAAAGACGGLVKALGEARSVLGG